MATRRKSQRHATNIHDTGTQQQQGRRFSQDVVIDASACVLTRRRKRRHGEAIELEPLMELRARRRKKNEAKQTETVSDVPDSVEMSNSVRSRTRRTKEVTQDSREQLMSGKEEATERMVDTQTNTKERKQSGDRTTEAEAECSRAETERLREAKGNRRKKTIKEPKEMRRLNEKIIDIHIRTRSESQTDQPLEVKSSTRKLKVRKQTEYHRNSRTKNEVEFESTEPEDEQVKSGTREKDRTQTGFPSESSTKDDRCSNETVAGGTGRQAEASEAAALVSSGNLHKVDFVLQKASENETASPRSVTRRTRRSERSTSSDTPESEPVSSAHRSNPIDSGVRLNLGGETRANDAEDDVETKWHAERRTNLPRSVDDAITLPVTCGSRLAELVLNRLESGSRGACVRLDDGSWLTPNEFQLISGRGNAKDWKRSIRHHGHSLKSLAEQGLLSLASPPLCICEHCDVQVSFAQQTSRYDVHSLFQCLSLYYIQLTGQCSLYSKVVNTSYTLIMFCFFSAIYRYNMQPNSVSPSGLLCVFSMFSSIFSVRYAPA